MNLLVELTLCLQTIKLHPTLFTLEYRCRRLRDYTVRSEVFPPLCCTCAINIVTPLIIVTAIGAGSGVAGVAGGQGGSQKTEFLI